MKIKNSKLSQHGFTLIELLVVIGIIAILASMILPALSGAKTKANIAKAKTEVKGIEAAIVAYYADYSRGPSSKVARSKVNNNITDLTFGTMDSASGLLTRQRPKTQMPNISTGVYQESNAEVMAILTDTAQWPNGRETPNQNHTLNQKKRDYYTPKAVSDINQPGLGPDGVLRDPWGNPYIISIDTNLDNFVQDAFYRLPSVSRSAGNIGANGLAIQPGADKLGFLFKGRAMVWSMGPDGMADPQLPAGQGANKDNVISW